jgi:CheY-like chemotaxis protein
MPRTILLADDSVTIRKVVELTFGDTDIRVESVGSGRDALDRLRDLNPDLVLADVVMPGPSGYDVCRAVKASARPVPVLLLTGTFEPFDPHEAKACGSDGHVTKPFDSRSLVERVETLLAASSERAAVRPEPRRDDLDALLDDLAGSGGNVAPAAPAASTPVPVSGPAPRHAAAARPAGAIPVASAFEAAADAAVAERTAGASTLSPADIDAVARAVVERLSDRVLREIAWDVVPDLAEVVLRERIRELERDDHETS